ncbi:MAG: PspC domain-containing protein [Bacteroidales bacterium]|jgi:phage shock protein C|nr:PspC domain-containing protein [Bacteroidales bacterium]
MTYRKLTRSRTNRKIAGVCGGLGDYLNIDPTVIRVLFILSILFVGCGLLLYLILIFIVPEE